MDYLPPEVLGMVIRAAGNSILQDLRARESELRYTTRLRQYLQLRLVSKTFDTILSRQHYDGYTLEVLLRRKQLEKLDIVLEAAGITADLFPANSHLSVPKLKRMCGKFWHNPDLTASAVSAVATLLFVPQNLNFAVKLEPWITRHQRRSESTTVSNDGVLVFEIGDWVVRYGSLSIRRLSRWNPRPKSKMGIYLAHESGQIRYPGFAEGIIEPVQARLGHQRRWYIEYVSEHGTHTLECLVNFELKVVWDNLDRRLYDFEGRQFDNFEDLPESATEDELESGDSEDENDPSEEE